MTDADASKPKDATAVEVGQVGLLKEDADFEKMSVDEAMRYLSCSPDGLSSQEAEIRLQKFGPNKLEETKKSPILAYRMCCPSVRVRPCMTSARCIRICGPCQTK